MNTPDQIDKLRELRRLRRKNRVLAASAFVLWAAAIALGVLNLHFHPSTPTPSFAPQTTAPAPTATSKGPDTSRGARETSAVSTTVAAESGAEVLQPPPLVVAAGGDVLGDRGVGTYLDRHGGKAVFEHVRPLLETAQLAFVNLEGPISDKGARATWKEYTFRARPTLLDGLLHAGVDIVSLANNHVLDYGPPALLDTFARLDRAGVCYAGAGKNAKQAAAPAILVTPAGTVAFLAFTYILPGGFAATKTSPGVNPVFPDGKQMQATIKAQRQKVDFVVVSFHWGTEYKFSPDALQQQLAHQAIDAGADLVLGHHPHVIQGLEIYKDRLIAYSLGDFVWDHYSRETGETFVLRVYLPRLGSPMAEVVPVYLEEESGVPKPVEGDAAMRILNRLQELCADLGVQLVTSESRAWVGFNPAAAGE